MLYTERDLVSFGNYLFERYDVSVLSNDGRNTPLYQRQVHDANLQNWKGIPRKVGQEIGSGNLLPSAHQYGDHVSFRLGEEATPMIAEIRGIHFFEGKVKYDLAVSVEANEVTRIYNVDSCWCKPIGEHPTPEPAIMYVAQEGPTTSK